MNPHKAESLFREYLSSPDPQIRKNALTALGAARLSGGYRDIVQAAMSDPDPGVRQRGEEEIAASGASLSAEYTEALRACASLRTQALDVYRLAGRIRARGTVASLGLPFWKRVTLAIRERASARTRVRGLAKSSFLVGLAAFIPYLAWLSGSSTTKAFETDVGAWVFLGCAGAAWLAVVVSGRWWRPIQAAASPGAALIVEALLLAGLGAVAGGIVCMIAAAAPFKIVLTPSSTFKALVTGGATFLAVRVGTAVAHGWSQGTRTNRIVETFAGISAGVLVITAISLNSPMSPLTSMLWVLLPTALPGLASAIARADVDVTAIAPHRRFLPRLGRPITVVLMALLVVEGVLPFVPAGRLRLLASRQVAKGDQVTVRGTSTTRLVAIPELPRAVGFTVDEAQHVRMTVEDEAQGRGNFKIDFKVAGADKPLTTRDDPPSISQAVQPGSYEVVVSDVGKINLDRVFPLLVNRVADRFRPADGVEYAASVAIEMSPLSSEESEKQRTSPSNPETIMARPAVSPVTDISVFDPRVRSAVERARLTEARAYDAARRARENAAIARTGGVRNPASGPGVLLGTGTAQGDRYEGPVDRGKKNGSGVYTFGLNPGNNTESTRYDGEFVNDIRQGFGVYFWRSGDFFAGSWNNGIRAGGINVYADGGRYEGDWANGRRGGYGVIWTKDGGISEMGIWADDKLTTPIPARSR